MKRLISIVLMLLLLTAAPAFGEAGKHECDGFASPEDAVLAYVDAFNEGDVEAMISTFAIESYIDNKDARYALERMTVYQPVTMYYQFPASNGYVRNLEVSKRYAEVADRLYTQYLSYNLPEDIDDVSRPITLSGADEIDALFSDLAASPGKDWFGNIAFLDWISPVALTDKYLLPKNLENTAKQAMILGCEDVADLAALLRVNEQRAILFMQCVKYNGLWYNYALQNNPATILGLGIYLGGLAVLPGSGADSSSELIPELELNDDAEAQDLYQRICDSPFPGTLWHLTAADADGSPVPCASAKDEAEASAEDVIFADLHMLRTGVYVRIEQGRLGRELHPIQGNCGKLSHRIALSWNLNADGNVEFNDVDNDAVIGSMSEGKLMITDAASGITMVFETDDIDAAAFSGHAASETWACPNCGAVNDDNFCTNCGAAKP